MNRREFLKTASAASALPVLSTSPDASAADGQSGAVADRDYWVRTLRRLAQAR